MCKISYLSVITYYDITMPFTQCSTNTALPSRRSQVRLLSKNHRVLWPYINRLRLFGIVPARVSTERIDRFITVSHLRQRRFPTTTTARSQAMSGQTIRYRLRNTIKLIRARLLLKQNYQNLNNHLFIDCFILTYLTHNLFIVATLGKLIS